MLAHLLPVYAWACYSIPLGLIAHLEIRTIPALQGGEKVTENVLEVLCLGLGKQGSIQVGSLCGYCN